VSAAALELELADDERVAVAVERHRDTIVGDDYAEALARALAEEAAR
jgi:hypothetical protein